MVVVTAKEMQTIDRRAITEIGIPSLVLMENAGVAVVGEIEREFGDLSDKRCIILVGKGNNGGDGLVIARHLLNRNAKVKVFLLAEEDQLSEDCRFNLRIFKKLQGEIHVVTKANLSKLKINLALTDLVIDALVGTGFGGEIQGLLLEVVRLVNNCRKPVVAVDIPTGVNATTGAVSSHAVKADLTVTLALLKSGLLLYPGREYCGKIKLVDIGIPKSLSVNVKRYYTNDRLLDFLPPRPAWGHKGTFGRCLIIAGSRSMTGAAYLAGQAALRVGAGLVSLAVPESIRPQFLPSEVITVPIPDEGSGSFKKVSIETLQEHLDNKDVLVIGPGLGSDSELKDVIEAVLEKWYGPLVLDADGINHLDLEWLKSVPEQVRRSWILTPHPGELGRLLDLSPAEINQNRLEIAWNTHKELGVNIVLKGAPTITAGDNQVYINSTGNSGMATAGTGDVLTGMISGLLAQGMNAFLAAAAGAYLHGRAGDYVGQVYSQRGITASDLLPAIPCVLEVEPR